MKIALVVPPKQKLAQDQYNQIPQIGIGYIASGLKKDGLDVDVYNSKYDNLYEKELTEILMRKSYDIIGFSSMTFEIKSVGGIAEKIKSLKKDCLIVVVGCHVNAIPKETMDEFPAFDLACIGEHEDQISSIFCLLHSRDYDALKKYDNIIFRRDGDLYYNSLNRRFITDLDELAKPAYELFGSKELKPAYVSSRGCPFSCSFCQQNSGRTSRIRNPVDLCEEIEYFSKYFNQKEFIFRDESFTAKKKHTIGVCNELIRSGLNNKLKWSCETHSRVADYELFCLMREAGCHNVSLGIESGSDEILKAIGKNTSLEIIKKAVNTAKRAKLDIGGFFILGHQYETKMTMLKTISFATRLKLDSISCAMLVPFPGTRVYEYARKNEKGLRLLTNDWERYDNYSGDAMAWDNFSVTTLKMFQLLALVTFNLYNLRFGKFVKYLFKKRKGILSYFISILRKH